MFFTNSSKICCSFAKKIFLKIQDGGHAVNMATVLN